MRRFAVSCVAVGFILLSGCATSGGGSAPGSTSAPAAGTQSRVLRYTFLRSGAVSGAQVTTVHPDGSRDVTFEFNDRGRGPKTASHFEFEGLIPSGITVTGNDYMKNAVSEEFAVRNSVATWSSGVEQGSEPLGAAPRFYLSMYGPPEEMAILARAGLEQPEVQLYPSGTARLGKLEEATAGKGAAAKKVALYQVSGLGLTPSYVWLDEDRELFANGSSWSSIVREGYEADAPNLLAAQEKHESQFFTKASAALTRPRAESIAITNARLFDPVSGTSRDGMTIMIRGNRIESVTAGSPPPSGATVVDAAGRTVMPGLWDMHTHLFETDTLLNIAAGVTSVRDLANDTETLMRLQGRIERGEIIGPRVMLTGIMDGPGPFAGPTKVLVATEDEARAAIDEYKRLGYEGIKVYSSIKPELVPLIVDHSHRLGLRVSGHIPAYMRAEQAVKLGFDEIQHANMLFLNFMPDVEDTRTPARFTAVAQRGADLDLQSPEVRAFITLLKDRGVVIDPTVSIFEGMFTSRPGMMSSVYEPIAHRLPPQVRRGFYAVGLPVPEGMDAQYRASYRKMLEMVKLLYDSGVQLVAGTDDFAGFTLHRELENYVAAGIPPSEVLRIATIDAARVMKRDRDLGTIEAGKLADLILIDGDPARDIRDLRKITHVMKDGVLYDSKTMYAVLGVQ